MMCNWTCLDLHLDCLVIIVYSSVLDYVNISSFSTAMTTTKPALFKLSTGHMLLRALAAGDVHLSVTRSAVTSRAVTWLCARVSHVVVYHCDRLPPPSARGGCF
jgi:hypothetical protein